MLELNLPPANLRIKKQKNDFVVFDVFRRRYVKLTPEEWVRQHFLHYLIDEKSFPAAWLAVESELIVNDMKKRFDALFYNKHARPHILIEFKAPNIPISQDVIDQISVYNTSLEIENFIISNGLEHFFCKLDRDSLKYIISSGIPDYNEI